MNKIIICGRLTREPETRTSASGTLMARYCIAVDRRVKAGEERQADFINCIVFGKGAEFAERYLAKGTKLIVEGHIQTGSYTNKDGQKVYTTDVVVESQEFAESKPKTDTAANPEPSMTYNAEGWGYIPEGADDTGLPFN